jgi:hypothetical protein
VAAVLISMGALLGKLTGAQLLLMTIIEIAVYSFNNALFLEVGFLMTNIRLYGWSLKEVCDVSAGSVSQVIKGVDEGGSITIHTFGRCCWFPTSHQYKADSSPLIIILFFIMHDDRRLLRHCLHVGHVAPGHGPRERAVVVHLGPVRHARHALSIPLLAKFQVSPCLSFRLLALDGGVRHQRGLLTCFVGFLFGDRSGGLLYDAPAAQERALMNTIFSLACKSLVRLKRMCVAALSDALRVTSCLHCDLRLESSAAAGRQAVDGGYPERHTGELAAAVSCLSEPRHLLRSSLRLVAWSARSQV